MTIEIRDASLEARIKKQLQATGSSSVEEVLLRPLEAPLVQIGTDLDEKIAFGWRRASRAR